jgi:hypothetical protein
LKLSCTTIDTLEINNSKHASILNQFKTWDCNYDSTSSVPGLFDRWYDYFYKLTWDEILNDSTKENVKLPGDPITIQLLNEDSKMKYFDLVDITATNREWKRHYSPSFRFSTRISHQTSIQKLGGIQKSKYFTYGKNPSIRDSIHQQLWRC